MVRSIARPLLAERTRSGLPRNDYRQRPTQPSDPRRTPSVPRQELSRLCGVGGTVADRHPERAITEISDEIQPPAKCFNVAGDHFDRCRLTMLDLRDAGDAHTHAGGNIPLGQLEPLARLRQLVAARLSEEATSTRGDLGRIHARRIQLLLQSFPILRSP